MRRTPRPDPLQTLREYLGGLPAGAIQDREGLLGALGPAWSRLDGCDDAGMHSGKLDRLEDPSWDPPRLRFLIERHGARVVGASSRAEMQSWAVDPDRATAQDGDRRPPTG